MNKTRWRGKYADRMEKLETFIGTLVHPTLVRCYTAGDLTALMSSLNMVPENIHRWVDDNNAPHRVIFSKKGGASLFGHSFTDTELRSKYDNEVTFEYALDLAKNLHKGPSPAKPKEEPSPQMPFTPDESDGAWKSAKDGESAVHSPKHYAVFDGGVFEDLDAEAIEIIARSMTVTEFGGYCKGNILKYRLRAGKKDKLEQDMDKVAKYQEIFIKFVKCCYDYNEQFFTATNTDSW